VSPAPSVRSSTLTILLVVTLTEIMLLGSGRLLQLGPLTIRMYVYLGALVCAALLTFVRGTIHRDVLVLVLGFSVLTMFSAMLGLSQGAEPAAVGEDVKPLLFFLSLPFFDLAITDRRQVDRVAAIVRICSLLLAAAYLLGLALLYAGVIPWPAVLEILSRSDEFFLRGGTGVLFYKSFLYLGIGFCFFLAGQWRSFPLALVLFTAIVLTLTRGMVLTAALIVCLAAALHRRRGIRVPGYLLAAAAAAAIAWPWFIDVFASRGRADEIRLWDLQVVFENTTWTSLLIGHGLGIAVGERERIEPTYAEILHQQGLLGLLFWAVVLAILTRDYFAASRNGWRPYALPFFLGAVFVYVESATNPFLTNPIGMTMVLVALVVLRRLRQLPREAPVAAMPPLASAIAPTTSAIWVGPSMP
jgi:hypothetical protein